MEALGRIIRYTQYARRAQTLLRLHSPFVYALSQEAIKDKRHYYAFDDISFIRKEMSKSDQQIRVVDYGAGSQRMTNQAGAQRPISKIAKTAGIPEKYGKLLYRLVKHLQPKTMLELGTSFGLGTMYLSSPDRSATMHTIEGCPSTAQLAQLNCMALDLDNVQVHNGPFKNVLPTVLKSIDRLDLAFIDGDHKGISTWEYFEQCYAKAHNDSCFIFDDINWSSDMWNCWQRIANDPRVTVAVDLYRMGFVFFRKEQAKEYFTLWY